MDANKHFSCRFVVSINFRKSVVSLRYEEVYLQCHVVVSIYLQIGICVQ